MSVCHEVWAAGRYCGTVKATEEEIRAVMPDIRVTRVDELVSRVDVLRRPPKVG